MTTFNNSGQGMTQDQYEVLTEFSILWNHNVFWNFLCIQGTVFGCENRNIIKDQTIMLGQEYGDTLGKYYGIDVQRDIIRNMDDFFNTYIHYIDSLAKKRTEECKSLWRQWNDMGNLLAHKFSSLNPNWKEMELRGMISNEIKILNELTKDNIVGKYISIKDFYDIYSSVANELSLYMAVGVIKQFKI